MPGCGPYPSASTWVAQWVQGQLGIALNNRVYLDCARPWTDSSALEKENRQTESFIARELGQLLVESLVLFLLALRPGPERAAIPRGCARFLLLESTSMEDRLLNFCSPFCFRRQELYLGSGSAHLPRASGPKHAAPFPCVSEKEVGVLFSWFVLPTHPSLAWAASPCRGKPREELADSRDIVNWVRSLTRWLWGTRWCFCLLTQPFGTVNKCLTFSPQQSIDVS